MEWKMILRKKKVIGVLFAILILQVLLFLFQTDKSMASLEENQKYVKAYHDNVEATVNQADSIGTISIFSKSESFSNRNLEQTRKDFEKLLDVEPVACDGTFLNCFFAFSTGNVITLLAGLCLVLVMHSQEKKGLKCMLFSSKNGRGKLTFRRTMALCFWNFLITVIFYGVTLLVSALQYGITNTALFTFPIQSISMFANLPWKINIGTFLILYFIYHWCVICLISLTAWMIMYIFDQLLISVGVFSLLGIMSYIIFRLIGVNHPLNYLHYCNPCYLLWDASFFTEYKNLNLLSNAVNKNSFIIVTGLVICFGLILVSVAIGEYRYPYLSKSRKIDRWAAKLVRILQNKWSMLQEKLSLSGAEYYKLLISQKGLLILLTLGILFVSQIDGTQVKHSGEQEMYYEFMEQNCGKPNEKTKQALAEQKSKIQEIDDEYETKCELFENGKLSDEDYINAVMKSEAYENERLFLKQMEKQTEYLEGLKEQRNITGWYINIYSYKHLLQSGNVLWNLVFIIGIALLGSGIFSWERKSGIEEMIRGSELGRKEFFGNKMRTILILVTGIYLVFSLLEIGVVERLYGLQGLSAPVQSIEQLCFLPFEMSVEMFLVLLYVLKGILLLSFVMIVSALSLFLSQKAVIAVAVVGCVPSVFAMVGYSAFRYFSLPELLSVATFLIKTQSVWMMVFVGIVFMITAFWSMLLAYRRWCTTYGG